MRGGKWREARILQDATWTVGLPCPSDPKALFVLPRTDAQQRHGAAGPAGAAAAASAPAQTPAAKAPPAPTGKKKLGGLKLAVGSQMDKGEWTSQGQFLKKDKPGPEIPNGLQQIKADDLVKVRRSGGGGCRAAAARR